MTKLFENQTVLITGAAGGFGSSMAELFAAHGANLVLSDYYAEGLDRFAAQMKEKGHDLASLSGNVAHEDHCKETVDLALKTFGRLDIAINNAGIGHLPAKTADVDSKQALATVQVDLMGVFYGMKHQIKAMEEGYNSHGRQASIVNVASLAGIGGAPTLSMYAAAKHGVVGLTKSAALEYARRGIRINAICPAFARTAMVEEGILAGKAGQADAEAHLTRGIPMKRLAEPGEITQSVIWVCDPKNSFMTGQAIALDGGTSAM